MNKELEPNREIACEIVDFFDDLLYEKGIEIPCSDEQEEAERHSNDNEAKIYGLEYWNLVNQVQSILDGIH